MVTAAHALCCTQHNELADMMDIYFGYQSEGNYFYHYSGPTEYWYGTTFEDGYTYENMLWDYGIIHLYEDVGQYTGAFGMTRLSDQEIDGAVFQLAGYRDGEIMTDYGVATGVNDEIFYHDADTEPGYSGGPVFNSEYYVTGINVAEHTGEEKHNTAVRITDDILDYVYQSERL